MVSTSLQGLWPPVRECIFPARPSYFHLAVEVGADGVRFLANLTAQLGPPLAFAPELVSQLQGRQHRHSLWRRGLGAPLHLADLLVDHVGERMHVRLLSVALDGVALARDGDRNRPFQSSGSFIK